MAFGKRGRAEAAEEYGSDGGFVEDAPKGKKTKAASKKTAADDEFWSLDSSTRTPKRATVSEFAKKNYVNLREYYEDKESGEMKPGKKGIALNVEQFNALLRQIPEISKALEARGETVVAVGASVKQESGDEAPRPAATKDKPVKSNIEATDSEDGFE